MSEQSILLVSYASFEKDYLEEIAWDVTNEFRIAVSAEPGHLDLSDFYDPMRRQYDGNRILKFLHQSNAEGRIKKMGLFQVDLFIPILTYIFGQAALGGDTGIASLYRLRNEQYGMKKDDDLLKERFRKVIIHELGHMFGLIHCHHPTCVMRSSTYVEDIDQKNQAFCSRCRAEMKLE